MKIGLERLGLLSITEKRCSEEVLRGNLFPGVRSAGNRRLRQLGGFRWLQHRGLSSSSLLLTTQENFGHAHLDERIGSVVSSCFVC
jgi:hypothetical protein